MLRRIENTRRSNHSVFLPQNYGSPFNDASEHISGLGLRRLDFERYAIAGEVIYAVEGDALPTSQQDEEARIATLAHALKKFGDSENAAEFMRCLNSICKEGDARYRQMAASYFYNEIGQRDAGAVLKETDQYDEGGAIMMMSAHERTIACGRVDPEFSADDLPECARYLAGELRRAYADGVEIEKIWDEINEQIEIIFLVSGKTANGGRFYSHANRELQIFARQTLEAILDECGRDFHLTALRNNRAYRRFYWKIRSASDTRMIGELMKQAYEARQNGEISVKHFIALNAAADNQRERLLSAPLSSTAYQVIEEIVTAPEKRLGYLAWAMYGVNQPSHPIHALNSREQTCIWEVMTARKAAILLPRLYAKLCATWGRAMPVACFLLLAACKDFFELPRLRKVLSAVRNKRRASIQRTSSERTEPDPTRGHPAMKREAVARLRSQTASCAQQ